MSAPRLTEAEKQDMLRRYCDGENVYLIAAFYGVDASYPGLLARRRGAANRMSRADRDRMSETAKARHAPA